MRAHRAAPPAFEPLEPRVLCSAATEHPTHTAKTDALDLHATAHALPPPSAALTDSDIKNILERAIARATKLGVNATLAISDREGNLLAVVRTSDPALDPAELTVDIDAGGRGGLEPVDGIIATSLIAATKAGTAAFLSTSRGNAFTTRTAGQIIQHHFPPGIRRRPGGPLFGVQLSNLPTSDVNRLPLGLAADPGGLPLYRHGRLVGGIGVEVNGIYTVDPTRLGGRATVEEKIALAGQIGYVPRHRMRADRIFVDGIRLDYANALPPRRSALGPLPDFDALVASSALQVLIAPHETPAGPTGQQSKFTRTSLQTPGGRSIAGEVPDGSQSPSGGLDFFDETTGSLAFIQGDENAGQRLTEEDVTHILGRAHALNHRLRAAIRTDQPQRSQVTVSVVDVNGNVLGVFRAPDAPMFGYDVSVQKARTAAFMSRPDAAAQLSELDSEVGVDDTGPEPDLHTLLPGEQIVDPQVNDPYARHVQAAGELGVGLDGSVAMSDRAGGFLSRPDLPDGIDTAGPGPFTALAPDRFSPFNTGLQTILIIPQLVEFLLDFNDVGDEAAALAMFADGSLGASGAAPLESNAGDSPHDLNPGGGLPAKSLANGMQIFAGSVPLYKNGVLVGAVGVSGDGIEQDDFVAFAGSGARLGRSHPDFFQEFGPTRRADRIVLPGGFRLPYVKLPRNPFAGV